MLSIAETPVFSPFMVTRVSPFADSLFVIFAKYSAIDRFSLPAAIETDTSATMSATTNAERAIIMIFLAFIVCLLKVVIRYPKKQFSICRLLCFNRSAGAVRSASESPHFPKSNHIQVSDFIIHNIFGKVNRFFT